VQEGTLCGVKGRRTCTQRELGKMLWYVLLSLFRTREERSVDFPCF
jgi:hypothetical protein